MKIKKPLNILISAGPTLEAIDPVRFISNHSSGKMGFAVAKAFIKLGHRVTIVAGPVNLKTPKGVVRRIDVISTNQMYKEMQAHFKKSDVTVMVAAVCDYRVKKVSRNKIKKNNENPTLKLVPTVDILASLGKIKKPHQTLVGFCAETKNLLKNARLKLLKKNLDMIVANQISKKNPAFGVDKNLIWLLETNKQSQFSGLKSKLAMDLAKQIVLFYSIHRIGGI